MKKGFTLIEMLVVIAMIAVMMTAMSVSVSKARTRARVAKANQETREMTNAILAYEQYAKDRSLADQVTGGSWKQCTESDLAFILGGETDAGGEEIPVLFNANVRGGNVLDPWGRPYEYMIEKTGDLGNTVQAPRTAAALPNFYRLTDEERGK